MDWHSFDWGGRRSLGVYVVKGQVWFVRCQGQHRLDEQDIKLTVAAWVEAGLGRRARRAAHGPVTESMHFLDHLCAIGLLHVDGRAVICNHLRS